MKLVIPILVLELIFAYFVSKILNDSFAVIKTNLIIKGGVVLISSVLVIFLINTLDIGRNKYIFYSIILLFVGSTIFSSFFFVKEVKDNFFIELHNSIFSFSLFIRLYFPLMLSLGILFILEFFGFFKR